MNKHSLTLTSSRGSSGEVSAWARTLAAKAGIPADRIDALDLCIVELVTNVVDHCYRGKPGEILVELELGRGAAILTVIDQGRAFDPLNVPEPVVPALIEDAPIGGYGIHLVRSTADRCRYQRDGGRNYFTAYFDVK
jgi:anti-sigma regulatory factor (Ser/Thr protein kinase)